MLLLGSSSSSELGCGSGLVGLATAAWLAHNNCHSNSNCKENSRHRTSCKSSSTCSSNNSNSNSNNSSRVVLTDLPVYVPAIEGTALLHCTVQCTRTLTVQYRQCIMYSVPVYRICKQLGKKRCQVELSQWLNSSSALTRWYTVH